MDLLGKTKQIMVTKHIQKLYIIYATSLLLLLARDAVWKPLVQDQQQSGRDEANVASSTIKQVQVWRLNSSPD